MNNQFTRRKFLNTTAKAVALSATCALAGTRDIYALPEAVEQTSETSAKPRIVDIHTHFDPDNPNYLDEFLKMAKELNLTGCMLTPFENRKVVAEAAKKFPREIVPFGYVDLDAPDVVKQVEELHALGYRGLGELEFVKKQYNDPSYFPVYELANRYQWVVLFHTGIVAREKFKEPEDVASFRMSAVYLEEIARRFPKITVVGAHCGNPDYQWAAEIARWNPNVYFDLSGSTLKKLGGRLDEFLKYFWWSGTDEGTETPDNDPSAFTKVVFGSDTGPKNVGHVLSQYQAMFEACGVPESARRLVLGRTLAKILRLPE
jgi:predicted TIM-barrel fold metal-dependent hydrolase